MGWSKKFEIHRTKVIRKFRALKVGRSSRWAWVVGPPACTAWSTFQGVRTVGRILSWLWNSDSKQLTCFTVARTSPKPKDMSFPAMPTIIILIFCEKQWRHPVKTKLYNTPSPILHSVKRSDVTRWKQGYIRPPPPYFIVLASSVKTKEVKVIEFHRIDFEEDQKFVWRLF